MSVNIQNCWGDIDKSDKFLVLPIRTIYECGHCAERHSLSAPGHNDQLLYRDHSPDTWFLLAVSQIYDNAMIEKINHYSGQKMMMIHSQYELFEYFFW